MDPMIPRRWYCRFFGRGRHAQASLSDWKLCHRQFKRFTPLGIIENPSGGPLNFLTPYCNDIWGEGRPNYVLIMSLFFIIVMRKLFFLGCLPLSQNGINLANSWQKWSIKTRLSANTYIGCPRDQRLSA